MRLNLSLGAIAALQLASNLLLQLVLVSLLGPGEATDAYIAAQTMPVLLIAILATSLQNVWQPRFAVLHDKPAEWHAAQRTAQGQALLLIAGSCLLLLLTTRLWVPLLFPGFSTAQQHLTAELSGLLLLGALFNGHAALFTAAQRGRDRFIGPELLPLFASLLMIVGVALTLRRYGVEVVAWASLARSVTVCLVLYLMAGRPLPAPVRGIRSGEAWRAVRPLLLGSALYKTGPLIDRFWMSQAPAGSVTVFNLVQTGMAGVAAVLERTFTVSAAPRLARLAEQRDMQGIRSVYRGCIGRTTLVVSLLSLALLAAYPIWPWLLSVTLRIETAIAHQMWIVLLLLLGYLHVASCGSVVMQTFYALGETRLPVQVSSVMFVLGAIIKSVAFIGFGMYGLALATSAYYLANLVIMCLLLERRIGVQLPARS